VIATSARRVVVEESGGDWLAMDETGQITVHADPESVVKAIRRADAKRARTNDALTITQIEWRDMAPGFVPPEVTS
jgi:hypothetical protein